LVFPRRQDAPGIELFLIEIAQLTPLDAPLSRLLFLVKRLNGASDLRRFHTISIPLLRSGIQRSRRSGAAGVAWRLRAMKSGEIFFFPLIEPIHL
jgi:hypothetical protein